MNIPKDPHILLSYINTMLRDKYISLEDLCSNLDVEQHEVENVLNAINYTYDRKQNRFTAVC